MADSPANRRSDASNHFGSTQWSDVFAASGDGEAARIALDSLCRVYWPAVYGYVRPRSKNAEDSYDLTQGFFAQLLERKTIARADPQRGKFRSFLLTTLKHYLANEHATATALKRGGACSIVSLDALEAEVRYAPVSRELSPDQQFERRWAFVLLETVMELLRKEQVLAGREIEFQMLKPFLTGEQENATLVDVSRKLGVTSESVRVAVFRLRKRYQGLLREEVARTVESPADVDDELRNLISAVSR